MLYKEEETNTCVNFYLIPRTIYTVDIAGKTCRVTYSNKSHHVDR